MPAAGRHSKDIGIAQPLGIDRLAALDEGRGAEPVTQDRGGFKVERCGRRVHLLVQLGLHIR